MKLKDFEESVKEVLVKSVSARKKYQNKKPTKKQLNTKWKLEKQK